ncbi:hypothetical protein B0X71_18225 [Planococcus lenghuensis]|uniref:N-acetyltransferase domain-containing protein n=2 Tax=Planococcus lenghuensis TaxID=2213202 RepID=A0A1Q2L5L5_9BACL|nr:hypothetical protein B0X71_18225 [Planococcus lenghuensis]
MDEAYKDWLLGLGFRKISAIVEYTKELEGSADREPGITAESLAESILTDSEFAVLYDRCRSGSANKNNLFSIEQIMESLSSELGADWRVHCFIFRENGQAVGISIPHIEQGTADEGRLFYFGVVPEERGKGYGAILHRLSLGLMRERFNAIVYVGSTDESNRHMIRIFERNGCRLRDKKGIYRIGT